VWERARRACVGTTVGVGHSAWYACVQGLQTTTCHSWIAPGRSMGKAPKKRCEEGGSGGSRGAEAGTRVCEASGPGRWSATPVTGRNRVLRGARPGKARLKKREGERERVRVKEAHPCRSTWGPTASSVCSNAQSRYISVEARQCTLPWASKLRHDYRR